MSAIPKVWHLVPHDREAIERLATQMNASPVVAQLLLNRGLADPKLARRFLDAPLTGLHPPISLPGMPEAVERLYDNGFFQSYPDSHIYEAVGGVGDLFQALLRLENVATLNEGQE